MRCLGATLHVEHACRSRAKRIATAMGGETITGGCTLTAPHMLPEIVRPYSGNLTPFAAKAVKAFFTLPLSNKMLLASS